MTTWFAIAGSLFALVGFLDYYRTIIWGRTRPSPVSWGVWSLISLLGLFSAEAGGAGVGTIVVATFFVLIVGTFLLSLSRKYGDREWAAYELWLGAAAAVTLILWKVLDLPDGLAVSVAVLADGFAVWPTLKKAWLRTDTEPVRPWVFGTIGFGFGILAVEDINYVSMAYPAYLFVSNILIVGASAISKRPGFALAATKGPSVS